jgi:hypothetical protein
MQFLRIANPLHYPWHLTSLNFEFGYITDYFSSKIKAKKATEKRKNPYRYLKKYHISHYNMIFK